jgi:bisphosphoglycerate-independent phosphoglycerate mutase (AlkP superfamily)
MLGFPGAPALSPAEAGRKLVSVADEYDFSLFEYWASDYAGHKQQMETAVQLMETFDGVLGGIVAEMHEQREKDGRELLVLVTSDHGNMEDLSTRKHTDADVPALVIGNKSAREDFTRGMKDLTDIAPAIWQTVTRD